MRIPQTPPDPSELIRRVMNHEKSSEFLQFLLGKIAGGAFQGRYLHWDDLRHREHPDGYDRVLWWTALKISRLGSSKIVPLLDTKQKPFKFVFVDQIHEKLHQFDQRASGNVQMLEQVTNSGMKERYYVSSLIEEAITSSMLEGAVSTRAVAKEMIRTGRPPKDRSEQMIFNNYRTMQRIGDLKGEKLTPDLVLEIHRLVTDGTLDDAGAAGRFRRDDERTAVMDNSKDIVIYHVPPPADTLNQRLARMCEFANSEKPFIHPVLRSIILHFWLAYDHPFVDGNGRTARALFYWSMLRHEYWMFEFISISNILLKAPAKYGRAFLLTETDENDLTYFILHQIDVMDRAIGELHGYLNRKVRTVREMEDRLRGISAFNVRQRALLMGALKNPRQTFTIRSHKTSWNVVHQTARTDLLELFDRGLLRRKKEGRTYFFTPAPNLEDLLREMNTP